MIRAALKKNGFGKYGRWLLIFVKCLFARILLLFLKRTKRFKHVWAFAERGVDARDNAFCLFEYVRKVHPEVNAVYLITENSPDREKFFSKDRLIEFGSLKHYLFYLAAEVKVSAHIFGGAPEHNLFLRMSKVKILKKIFVTGKYVFLQHGVTQADGPWLHRDKVEFDLFVTVSDRESEYVEKCFGHPHKIVQTLGFARYDFLPFEGVKSKKILLMPTWRHFLSGMSAESFKTSEYFRNIEGLIQNSRLKNLLVKYDYQLIFYPHFEVQKYLNLFQKSNEKIVLASFEKFDVQKLLIDCDLLITDYSSVQFDFSYMKKPVILFQFDREDYRSGHQGMGYFDPDRDGFGPVGLDIDKTVDLVENYLAKNCELENVYQHRIEKFFKYTDAQNCKRNYEAIQGILK